MKKHATKKLALASETLLALTADALANVQGGNIPTVTESRVNCPTAAGQRTCILCVPDQAK